MNWPRTHTPVASTMSSSTAIIHRGVPPMNDSKATAKLFMHGRGQAVRLPKEFRFEGSEVRVSRIGHKVILEPLTPAPFDVKCWRTRLRALGAADFFPEGRPDQPPLPADSALFD